MTTKTPVPVPVAVAVALPVPTVSAAVVSVSAAPPETDTKAPGTHTYVDTATDEDTVLDPRPDLAAAPVSALDEAFEDSVTRDFNRLPIVQPVRVFVDSEEEEEEQEID